MVWGIILLAVVVILIIAASMDGPNSGGFGWFG